MKKTLINTGRILKMGVLLLCFAALPALTVFTVTVSSARADQTVGQKIDDTVITAKVKKDLMTDAQFKYGDVKVNTIQGTVVLSGFANSSDARGHAVDVAKAVEGVQDVKNDITLK